MLPVQHVQHSMNNLRLQLHMQGLVEVFQGHSKASQNISTVADMLNFVENFSEFSAAQRNAGKHVTLMSELSRHVDARSLMQASCCCIFATRVSNRCLEAFNAHIQQDVAPASMSLLV